jgi:predicted nucleic acid-binding protein
MRLKNIPPGIEVFIDANIFIYHFTGNSAECTDFLSRCEEGVLRGSTSTIIVGEVMHRLMLAEAEAKKLARAPQILRKLKDKPEIVCRLTDYFIGAQAIFNLGIKTYPLTAELIMKSQAIRARYGLMANDSLIAATMEDEGVEVLATNNDGFSRVDWIHIHKPEDIKSSPARSVDSLPESLIIFGHLIKGTAHGHQVPEVPG